MNNNENETSIKGSTIKGIFYGSVIDIVGSLIFGVLYGIGYAIILIKQGVPADAVAEKISSMGHWSLISLFALTIGCLISCYAGYICAKNSIQNLNRNSTILALISCSSGLLVGMNWYSFSENILVSILTAASIFLGAKIWKKRNS